MRTSLVGEYLRARRNGTQPEDVGLPREAHRRVSGLRREEVAALAGISPEYYVRLEQGRDHQPSAQVLDALARALGLDSSARAYLDRLAHPPRHTPTRESRRASTVSISDLAHLLAQWTRTPAYILDGNLDVVLANSLAEELGQGSMSPGANRLLTIFEASSRRLLPDWDQRAAELVASLRMRGDPRDPRLHEIVGSLSIRDQDFRRMWARQDVHILTSGACLAEVVPFGTISLKWQNLDIAGCDNHTLTTLYGEPGSPAVAALAYVAAKVDMRSAVEAA